MGYIGIYRHRKENDNYDLRLRVLGFIVSWVWGFSGFKVGRIEGFKVWE